MANQNPLVYLKICYICNKMNGSTILHIHFKKTDEDFYFGSLAAIFDTFDAADIGAAYSTLVHFKITPERPYFNKIVTIKKGSIIRKHAHQKENIKCQRKST